MYLLVFFDWSFHNIELECHASNDFLMILFSSFNFMHVGSQMRIDKANKRLIYLHADANAAFISLVNAEAINDIRHTVWMNIVQELTKKFNAPVATESVVNLTTFLRSSCRMATTSIMPTKRTDFNSSYSAPGCRLSMIFFLLGKLIFVVLCDGIWMEKTFRSNCCLNYIHTGSGRLSLNVTAFAVKSSSWKPIA